MFDEMLSDLFREWFYLARLRVLEMPKNSNFWYLSSIICYEEHLIFFEFLDIRIKSYALSKGLCSLRKTENRGWMWFCPSPY